MTPVEQATVIVNGVAILLFFGLVGAILYSMTRRIVDYRAAKLPLPTLLKRGFVLFGALAFLGGEAALLRSLGITMDPGTPERLVYILQTDFVLLGALLYYAKAELFDLDDEDKP